MGTIAARKAKQILSNVEYVLAIELMCAVQALDFLSDLKPGSGVKVAYELVRSKVPFLEKDRILAPEINLLKDIVSDGSFLQKIEEKIGALK